MRWYCKYYTFTQHIFFHPNSGIFHDSFFSPSCSLAPGSSKCVLLPWQLLRSPRFKGVRRGNEGCTTARLDLSDLFLRQKTKISTYFFKWWKIPKHSTETPTLLGVGWIFLWFFPWRHSSKKICLSGGLQPFSRLVYPVPEPQTSGLGVHATVDLQGVGIWEAQRA